MRNTFFLGLQIKKKGECMFINQSKYANGIFKGFCVDSGKLCATPLIALPPLRRIIMTNLLMKRENGK